MTIHKAFRAAMLIQQELIERNSVIDVNLSKARMRLHEMSPSFEVVVIMIIWRHFVGSTLAEMTRSGASPTFKRATLYIDEHGKLWPDRNSWDFAVGPGVTAWSVLGEETQGLAKMIYDQLALIQGELVYIEDDA